MTAKSRVKRASAAIAIALSTFALAAACGGSDASGVASNDDSGAAQDATSGADVTTNGDGGSDDGGAFVMAAHRALPVIPNHGSAVLAHPDIVTVTFATDPYADQEEAWGKWVVGSSWLVAAGSDYGVGAGNYLASIRLADSAPAMPSEDDLKTLVSGYISSGAIPAPTANIIYLLYFPVTTTLELQGQTSCNDFSGYHSSTIGGDAGAAVSFAAIGRCPTYWPGLSEWENIQRTASHEMIEAATDPVPGGGYVILNDGTLSQGHAWLDAVTEGEVGDLCIGSQVDQESGNIVQRSWSNSAAAAGKDPCAPASSAPYFSANSPQDWYPVSAGGSVTIPFTAWSAAPVPDWIVYTDILSDSLDFTVHTVSDTTLETDAGKFYSTNNGRSFTVTVTAPATVVSGDKVGLEIRSKTPSAETNPDSKREATYHVASVGVYIP